MMKLKGIVIFALYILLLSACHNDTISIVTEFMVIDDTGAGKLGVEEIELYNYYTYAEISFPQIEKRGYSEDSSINKKLKYIPFDMFGYRNFDTDEMLQGKLVPLPQYSNYYTTADFDYTIIHQDSDYISVEYYGTIGSAVRLNFRKCFVTLNVGNGELVSVEKFITLEKIIQLIHDGDFEVMDGTYLPGGWNGYEEDIKQRFISAIEWSYSFEEEEDTSRLINTDSAYHFGLTEESIIYKFSFDDSLDGYVVLKFDKQ